MDALLGLNAKEYGQSFVDCYDVYQLYLHIQDPDASYEDIIYEDGTLIIITPNYLRQLEGELKLKYESFARCLRKELNVTPDWSDQDILFTQLKLLMPDKIFDNDILKTDKRIIINQVVGKAVSKDDGVALISLIQTMSNSLSWFDHDTHTSILEHSLNKLNAQIPADIDDNEFFSNGGKGDKITLPCDEIADGKEITRDGTWFLFTMLRQKGVIKQMPDTELSELVSSLTDYSAEKLRQSKLHTQSSKDKLVSLLEDVITRIKT